MIVSFAISRTKQSQGERLIGSLSVFITRSSSASFYEMNKHHRVILYLLPHDRARLKRIGDMKKLADVLALELRIAGHVVRFHIRIDHRIAHPTIEWHFIAAKMNVLIRKYLHDLGE